MHRDSESLQLAIQVLEAHYQEIQNTYNTANQRTSTYLSALALLTSLLGLFVQQVLSARSGQGDLLHHLFPVFTLAYLLHNPLRILLLLAFAAVVMALCFAFALALSSLRPLKFQIVDNEVIDTALFRGHKTAAEVYIRDMTAVVNANRKTVQSRLTVQMTIGRWLATFVVGYLLLVIFFAVNVLQA